MHRFLLMTLFALLWAGCEQKFDGKDGMLRIYYPNSEQLKQEVEFKNGKRIGVLKEYYRNGKLKVHQHYVDDKLNDSSLFYHENGKLQESQYFKDFKRHGIWRKYTEKGVLQSETCFYEDALDSTSSVFTYRTGRLLHRWNYRSGMKHGKEEHYYNNGKPQSVAYWEYGQPCLGTEEWTESGEKIDNDFSINIRVTDRVLMEGKLRYDIVVKPSAPDDVVYAISDKDTGPVVTTLYKMPKDDGLWHLDYTVPRYGFVMEKTPIAVFKKTAMGNTVIKRSVINAASSNY